MVIVQTQGLCNYNFFANMLEVLKIDEALPGVLGNRGKRAFISGEQDNKVQMFRGTKTIIGNKEHKKTIFRFRGNSGTSQFISGEHGNRYRPPPPLGVPY